MTETLALPPEIAGPLTGVTDADRAWFEAPPHRRYHLRPTRIGELMPGEALAPGSHTLVVRCGDPGVRFRLHVGRPPAHLRMDTDRVGRLLLERMAARGFTINGRPLAEALAMFSASVAAAMQRRGAAKGGLRDPGDRP